MCYDVVSHHDHEQRDKSTGYTDSGHGNILTRTLVAPEYIFTPDTSVLDSMLWNSALERLSQKVRGDLDLSIDLAEAHKTAKMFDVVDKVVDYSRTFRRKYGLIKSASNAWLEYVYGVKPLLSSIYGLAEENLRVVVNKVAHHSARASAPYRPSTAAVSSIFGRLVNPIDTSTFKRSVTIGVDLRDPTFDIARFTSLNPLSIAWELTPYSFVVDWFVGVGSYLRNYENYLLYASRFQSGYRTWLLTGECSWNWGRPSPSTVEYTQDNFKGRLRISSIDRAALSTYPAPNFPSFKVQLGSSRLLSAASLLGQVLRGR